MATSHGSRFEEAERLIDRARDDAKRVVRERLAELYPDDADRLLRICLHRIDYPLGYGHLRWFVGVAGSTLDPRTALDLRVGYVLLSAYYFLLDAVVDDHLDQRDDALGATQLLAGAIQLLTRAAAAGDPQRRDRLDAIVRQHLAENAAAVRTEMKFRSGPGQPVGTPAERDSIVGRSNSSLLLYRLLCVIAGVEPSDPFIAAFRELLFLLQQADDLGDWRADLAAGQWTAILRETAGRAQGPPTEAGLETELFLGGAYETYLARLVNGLDRVLRDLRGLRGLDCRALSDFVDAHSSQVPSALHDFVQKKLSVTAQAREA